MDFKDFCEQEIPESTKIDSKIEKQTIDNVQEQLDKYKNKSEDELMQEFLKVSHNIDLNEEKIRDIKQTLNPMLNDQQKQKMEQLLNQIRK